MREGTVLHTHETRVQGCGHHALCQYSEKDTPVADIKRSSQLLESPERDTQDLDFLGPGLNRERNIRRGSPVKPPFSTGAIPVFWICLSLDYGMLSPAVWFGMGGDRGMGSCTWGWNGGNREDWVPLPERVGRKALVELRGAGLLGWAGTLRLVFPEAMQEEANYLKFLEV